MKTIKFLFFMMFAAASWGQNTVEFTVNSTQGEAILGAEIYFNELHKGNSTDENGQAEIAIPQGKHNFTISYLGFKTFSGSIDSSTETKITITLEESIFGLDEIIVSTPFNQLQSQNVMKVESATAQQLKDMGSFDLGDGIAKMPGASQITSGTSLSKPVIRGLSGNRILVYSQGVRLENQQFGDDHSLGINGSGVSSVELIKGPASLLYGSDALGGVLYFNPEKFADANDFKASIDQSFNSGTLGSNTSLMVANSGEKFGIIARGTYNAHMDYALPDEGYVHNSRFNEKDFKLGLNFDGENSNTNIRYSYNHNISGILETHEEEGHLEEEEEHEEHEFEDHDRDKTYTPAEPYQDVVMQVASLHHHTYFGKSKLIADIGFSQNDRKEIEHHEDHEEEGHEEEEEHEEEAALHLILNAVNYNLRLETNASENLKWTAAIQGTWQDNKNYGEEELVPNATTNDIGAYVAVNFKNAIQAGIRFDHRQINSVEFTNDYNSVNGAIGWKADLSQNLTQRINVATGFRAPNLAELGSDGIHHGSNRYEIGNADLQAEQNIQFDYGLEYSNEHFEFYVNAFYNVIDNFIYLENSGTTTDGFEVYNYVQDAANLYGGETGIHLHPHPLDWFHFESAYQLVYGEQREDKEALPFIPPGRWNNTIRAEFQPSETTQKLFVALNYEYNFDQNRVAINEDPTAAYGVLNFNSGVTWKFDSFEMGANLNLLNILDDSYIPHLSRFKPLGIPNPGRSVMLGVNINM
ncbi:MAG: TonB-dependent receptor [Flavobacteriaceae bacterium]